MIFHKQMLDALKQVNFNAKVINKIDFNFHFHGGAFVEIVGSSIETFKVEFRNYETDKVLYSTNLDCGHWAKCSFSYFLPYQIQITDSNNQPVFLHTFSLENKRVLICFDSHSLGDNIAWINAVEEFRKKHNCIIFCSTFWNSLFEKVYPDINFVKPGTVVEDIYAVYNIGIYLKDNKIDLFRNPVDPRAVPLQKIAFDILGLPFEQNKPKIHVARPERQFKEKYITINTSGSAGFKLWHRPGGWREIIDYVYCKYRLKTVLTQLEPSDLQHVTVPKDKSIENTINLIKHSEFHIGTSSGPLWLAYALKPLDKIIIISGFTESFNEFPALRPMPKASVCQGCYNKLEDKYLFFTDKNRGNWNFCPEYEGTNKHFECSKSISPEDVIQRIDLIFCESYKCK